MTIQLSGTHNPMKPSRAGDCRLTNIEIHSTGRTMTVQICRPEKKNALTTDMYRDLTFAIHKFEADDHYRAFVIFGDSESFSAGNDIKDFIAHEENDLPEHIEKFLSALTQAEKPLLAGVSGLAIGIGVTMLLHCDLVYATADATFQLPFLKLGLVPEAGSSLILPQLVGHRRASELLYFGEAFDAETAKEIGLVNRIAETETLREVTLKAAEKIASLPPDAVRRTKQLLRSSEDNLSARIEKEFEAFKICLKSPESEEALRAFIEKRPPDFTQS